MATNHSTETQVIRDIGDLDTTMQGVFLGADQRHGIHLAGGAVRGIGGILFSHSDGGIQGMSSTDIDYLYMSLMALGRYVEDAIQEVDQDIDRMAKTLETAK